MRLIHIADSKDRNAYVRFISVKAPKPPGKFINGSPAKLRRFLSSGEKNTFTALSEKYGDALDAALIANDPEVDIELIGRPIEKTNTIYLDSENNIMQMAPEWIESILDVNGIEKEQRKPQDRFSNIAEEIPIRFTKTRLKKSEAIHRFAFTRTVQLWHSDGLTYEFLHGIAEDLDKSKEMMLLGGGSKAKEPLIFQLNGLPWRAFLEGRISEEGYCLLLRLSNLELKPFSQ